MTRFREDIFEWRAKLVACLLAESESEPVSFGWMLKSLQHRVVVGRRACQPSDEESCLSTLRRRNLGTKLEGMVNER